MFDFWHLSTCQRFQLKSANFKLWSISNSIDALFRILQLLQLISITGLLNTAAKLLIEMWHFNVKIFSIFNLLIVGQLRYKFICACAIRSEQRFDCPTLESYFCIVSESALLCNGFLSSRNV
ncbi:hypothetical protein OC71_25205 [Pseudomonas sp. W15Feb9B]|nr:hypothetical protein OC71_25205 [Pseudomonas sp. W15Feb9B]